MIVTIKKKKKKFVKIKIAKFVMKYPAYAGWKTFVYSFEKFDINFE